MGTTPRISEAEWEVMKVVWDEHPITAAEVADRLRGQRDWTDRTVKTLLGRLVRKGALAFEVDGRRYRYTPAVSREQCVRAESRSFVERVFDGAGSPMLVHMVREADLSAGDIEELRRILGEKEAS